MTRDEAKSYILNHSTDYLRQDKSKRGYICPICSSGSGNNGTGITTKDKIHFTCWSTSSCFMNADIFDIVGKEKGLSSYNEQLSYLCNFFRIDIDSYSLQAENRPNKQSNYTKPIINTAENKTEEVTIEVKPFTELYKQAHYTIHNTQYYKRRGLSEETINRFNVGFIKEWKHPKAPITIESTPRLIIPITDYTYLARDTREIVPQKDKDFKKQKVKAEGVEHASWIFNAAALEQTQQPIFVVEGEIDAMSVCEVGGEAIALGSTSGVNSFVNLLKNRKPKKPLLIALDNDKNKEVNSGQNASKDLEEKLKEIGATYRVVDIVGEHKDANEALVADRESFKAAVERAKEEAAELLSAEEETLRKESIYSSLQELKEKYKSGEKPLITPTGFNSLDEILNGGLRAGLYVLGAISSLGKTSLAIQIADNIAAAGQPILFVSLEMAREELTAKLLSRLTYIKSMECYKSFNEAKTTVGILDTHRFKYFEKDSQEVLTESIADLEKRANNFYILEGVGNIGAAEIKEKTETIRNIRGITPIVFIDYLQILAPQENFRGTDKQAIDKSIVELKRLSRDCNTAVVAISSFSRNNYNEPVNLASFKESGAIEYTADVLLGMQLKGIDRTEEDLKKGGEKTRANRINDLIDKALENGKAGKEEELEIKVLKNRNGSKGGININFVPKFNYFKESEEPYKLITAAYINGLNDDEEEMIVF